MLRGLLLGLTTGTSCLASCAPVLLPYFLGGDKNGNDNALDLCLFLLGKLLGYLIFAVIAWSAGNLLLQAPSVRAAILAVSYLSLGSMLIVYTRAGTRGTCGLRRADKVLLRLLPRDARLYPLAFGLLTGLNLCPPFLLALTDAANTAGLLSSIFFFMAFFLGTSLFFAPFALLGAIRKRPELTTVAELTAYLMAGYYLCKGILTVGSVW